MAVRLYSEFKSDRGYNYKIEIHDTQWAAASTTFKVDSRGFELTYDGETDDIVSPIVGSKLTFGAYSENGTFETFVDLLKTFQENRFRVVVYRAAAIDTIEAFTNRVLVDGGILESQSCVEDAINELGGVDENDLFWVGWIIQDLVNVEDESQPYVYNITAADGLGRLANIDYTANNNLAAGLTRVSTLIGNCIDFAGITDLWGAGDIYLETSVNWWETTIQTYATTKDTIEEHAIDILVFRGEDGDGVTTYSKAYDVLKELCITYGARIYQSNGRWIFEQYVNRTDTPRIVSLYDKTITRLSTSSRSDDITIDQTNGFARLTGAQFNFLPAVGAVSVEYARDKFNAISKPYTFKSTAPTKTLGIIGASTATQLKFYGPHNYNITSNTAATTNDETIAVVWRMQIRIESATTAGLFYYYNRALNGFATAPVYGAAAWSTTAGYYYYHSPFAKVEFGAVSINAAPVVITANLPTSGALLITSEHFGNFLPLGGTAYTLEAHQTDTWLTTLTIVRMDNANDDSISVTYRANNANANVNSKIELQLGTTRIANGLFQTGDLSVFNGATFVSGISFRRGASGAGNQILNLLTKEMLGLHAVPAERFNGQFFTAANFDKRFLFDGGYWVNIGGSFTANTDQWSGEWFRIDYAPANIGTISETPQALTNAVNGGSNIANDDGVIEVGRVGGMAVDSSEERIGPYEQTATGGRINGTANVTGAATLSSTLGVTGATTLSSTLGVTGASTLGTLNAGTTTLGASTIGSATITGNASVGGTTTLADVTANDAVLDNFVTKTAVIGTTGLVESFRARVLADGGTFEAFDEVVTAVTELLAGGSNKSAVVYGETQVQALAAEATSVTTLAASGAATMGSTLGVTGATTLSSTLGVTGTSTLATLNAAATSVSTLNASGATTLSSTLGVTGTSTLGALNAGTTTLGASTLASSNVTGNASVGGTLGVTGTSTLGTLSAAATSVTTLAASGATTLSSTLGVTGATTLSSTLGVTGATTMNAATINGDANLNASTNVKGSWNASIIDVDAGAAGEYTTQPTDYILFMSWSGGAGTFTIYLPQVATSEGRMIRIKTDSTISNSNALSIVPDAGDTGATIDGEGASAMTRPYDGATYLCHNGDWWLVQKKEK